jgi:branched-chain amino acid transport system substrate-binding protein
MSAHGTNRTMRRAAVLAAVLGFGAAAGGVAAAGHAVPRAADGEPIKLGLLLTSEGPFANNSDTARQGAEYAVEKLNDAGGIDGQPIELVTADSLGQPDQLATIMPRLATEDDVVAVIGPVESSSCDVACPLALQFELPLVSPGAARPGVLEPGRPYSFSLAQPDAPNATPALEYIVETNGIETAAIIYDEANATTVAQADLFRAVFEATGVEVLDEVTYTTGDASFAAQVTQIGSSGPDAVALAAGSADAGRIAVEIDAQGVETQLLGTGSLQSDINGYIEAAGDAANGTLTAAQYNPRSDDPVASELLAQAEEYLGVDEVPLNFAYAHDAVNIIAGIVADNGLTGSSDTLAADRVAIQEGLNALDGFVGMAEGTTFGDDGFSIRPILIAEVTDGEVVISPVESDDTAGGEAAGTEAESATTGG